MQIQPAGAPLAVRPEERPAARPEPHPNETDAANAAPASPDRETVSAAVRKLNESLPASAQSLEFSVDEESKDIVIRIIDRESKEVVRQIPTEEALQIARSIDKMQGLLIRDKA